LVTSLGKVSIAAGESSYDTRAIVNEKTSKLLPLTDLCVNGKQVLTESIADLAGLLVAHDAYILSLKVKDDVAIGGLSGEQRFFLAFAQRWRRIQSEAALR
jgi:predicted metalloendopeptidase